MRIIQIVGKNALRETAHDVLGRVTNAANAAVNGDMRVDHYESLVDTAAKLVSIMYFLNEGNVSLESKVVIGNAIKRASGYKATAGVINKIYSAIETSSGTFSGAEVKNKHKVINDQLSIDSDEFRRLSDSEKLERISVFDGTIRKALAYFEDIPTYK